MFHVVQVQMTLIVRKELNESVSLTPIIVASRWIVQELEYIYWKQHDTH